MPESMTLKSLLQSQRQLLYSLDYKKGEPENLEKWRPIHSLNADYNILSRV